MQIEGEPALNGAILGAIMNVTKPLGLDEIEISSEVEVRRNIRERDQVESADVKVSADDLAALLRRTSDVSIREIENLISELQAVRYKTLAIAFNATLRNIRN
jgi:hypothetical protein